MAELTSDTTAPRAKAGAEGRWPRRRPPWGAG